MENTPYLFHHTQDQAEYERLQMIEKVFDPYTQGYLETIGLGPGAQCLEIGPGAGSIARWMCSRIGPSGHVTALDLNTRFMAQINLPNLRVLQGDAAQEDLGCRVYDVIHARYVLIHIHEVQNTLSKIVRALKPGGWLLLEEPDFTYAKPETKDQALASAFLNVREAIRRMYDSMKLDPAFGGRLTSLLKENGLLRIGTRVVAESSAGGSGTAEMMKRSTLHLQDQYLKTGAVTREDIAHYCRLAEDPGHSAVYYGSVSSWGQKSFN